MQNSMSGGFCAYDKTKSVIACVTIADFFYIIIKHSKMFIVAHEKADGLSIFRSRSFVGEQRAFPIAPAQ